MKKLLLTAAISAMLISCGPGKWVPGNAAHFRQRDAVKKARALQAQQLADTKH